MNDKSKIDLLLQNVYDRAGRMRVSGIDLERCYQDMKREAAQIVMSAGYDWVVWCSQVSQHIHDLLVQGERKTRKCAAQEIPNLALFQRCRTLHEELDRLRAILPAPEVIAALERVDISEMPPDQQRLAKRILRDMADLTVKEAELETLAVQAEEAALLLSNKNLRRITQLYCIDGLSWADLLQNCPCSVRTVARHVKALKKHDEEADSFRADGR